MALAIASAITNSRNAIKSVEISNDINQFAIESTVALQSTDVCGSSLTSTGTTAFSKTTFINNNPITLDVGELKYANGQSIAKVGQNIPGSNSVLVTSVQLTNYRPMGIVSGEVRFLVDLQIGLVKGASGQQVVGGANVKPRKIPMLVRMNDTSGSFVACSAINQLTTATAPASTADCVATYGAGWTWSGSVCLPPSQTCASSAWCPTGTQGQICLHRTFQMCNGYTGLDTIQCLNGTWITIDSVPVEECGGG